MTVERRYTSERRTRPKAWAFLRSPFLTYRSLARSSQLRIDSGMAFGQSDRSHRADGGAQLLEELRVQRRRLFRIQILKEDDGIGLLNIEEGGRSFGHHIPAYARRAARYKRLAPVYWNSTTPSAVGRTVTPMSRARSKPREASRASRLRLACPASVGSWRSASETPRASSVSRATVMVGMRASTMPEGRVSNHSQIYVVGSYPCVVP
jgi:hypothetical protein